MSDTADTMVDEDTKDAEETDSGGTGADGGDAEPNEEDLDSDGDVPEPSNDEDAEIEVESIEELLSKEEAADEDDKDEDTPVAAPRAPSTRSGRIPDGADSRIVPIQETEFTCTRCFLVKHRGQLADKKKTLCRDCA